MEEYSYNMQVFKSQIYSRVSSHQFYKNIMSHRVTHVVVLIAIAIALTHTFRFTINSKNPELSMIFNVTKGKHTFSTVSSGQQNHDINITIAYSHSRVQGSEQILAKTVNDIDFSYNYPEDGRINVTILASTSGDRNVSFDFFSQDDPLVKMIDKKDLKLVEGILTHVHQSLSTISRNQQFHIERDQSHKVTLEDSQSSIKWTGIVKIVFLLSSALIQLWIMKGFFKGNSSHPYEPVETG